MVRSCRFLALIPLAGLLAQALLAQPQVKPIKRPENNELDLVVMEAVQRVRPPSAVTAETARLVFDVSPLSDDGLLSEQIEDAIKALDKANGRATIVHLRSFVAGNGDVRRLEGLVGEIFTDKKWPLPAMTTVQVGGLPMDGAQVVIEAISEDRDERNPAGLALFSAQERESVEEAVAELAASVEASGADPVRITCFADSLERAREVRQAVLQAYPRVQGAFVQATRFSYGPMVMCEGIGRMPEEANVRDDTMGFVVVRQPRIVFARAQLAFQEQASDLRLAYERLGSTLSEQGVGFDDVVLSRVYSLNHAVAGQAADVQGEFVGAGSGPAGFTQVFEGLPSYDASMAIEVVAAVE